MRRVASAPILISKYVQNLQLLLKTLILFFQKLFPINDQREFCAEPNVGLVKQLVREILSFKGMLIDQTLILVEIYNH